MAYWLSQIQTPARQCFDKQTVSANCADSQSTYQQKKTHQRQTRWTSKPNLNSCEWCTRCSLSFDLCISMSHTESLILIDLTTQSIQLLLSFASASFLSLETEATRSNTFKINMSFKFKVTLTPSKGSSHLRGLYCITGTWFCTSMRLTNDMHKLWNTQQQQQILDEEANPNFIFHHFYTLALCKFWLLQNFGTRIQNLLILYDPLWSYRLQEYYNTLAKKNMFRVSHAFQQLPGHCLRPGFVLLPVGEDWDMETSTTTVTQSASSQMSHQASGWQCRSTWRKSRHGHILSYFGCAPSNGLRPATSFQCQQGLHLFLQENFLAVVPGEPDQPCSGWRN